MAEYKPRAGSKAKAARAYKETFGRDPHQRMSGIQMMKRVDQHRSYQARMASLPEPSFKPMTTWDAVAGNTSTARRTAPAPSWTGAIEPQVSRSTRFMGAASSALPWVGVAAAAAQGVRRGIERGDSVPKTIARGVVDAAPAAFVAGHKQVAAVARGVATTAIGVAEAAMEHTGVVDIALLDMMFAKAAGASVLVAGAAKGVEKLANLAGKAVIPASIGVGALMGAMKDENRLRGAARGAATALDPTAIFMRRGLMQRGFDAVFGEADRPKSAIGFDNKDIDTHQGKGAIQQRRINSSSNEPRTKAFNTANANFEGMKAASAAPSSNSLRGWRNPAVQAAAQAARGREFTGFKTV